MMRQLLLSIVFCFAAGAGALAQKPFTEGTIVYKVRIISPEHKVITGTYTYTIKGDQVRKELKMNNGFHDVLLMDFSANTVYSLQDRNHRRYAVQLKMSDFQQKLSKYEAFRIINNAPTNKKIAGCKAAKCRVLYPDSSGAEVYFTKEWYPVQPFIFSHFPGAKFIPLLYSYTEDDSMIMKFEAEKVDSSPVENAVFRIPPDYKMISYKEYKELTR